MLTLTRREGQSIIIGDNIEIEVVDTRSDRVILRIGAPDDVKIARKELLGNPPLAGKKKTGRETPEAGKKGKGL